MEGALRLGASAETDVDAVIGSIKYLAAHLPAGDLLSVEAHEVIDGDRSKWPDVVELAVRLAERVAWAHGLAIEPIVDRVTLAREIIDKCTPGRDDS